MRTALGRKRRCAASCTATTARASTVDQHAIFGPATEVAARLREQVDAGITHLMLGVPTLDLAHLRRVAAHVAPVLRT